MEQTKHTQPDDGKAFNIFYRSANPRAQIDMLITSAAAAAARLFRVHGACSFQMRFAPQQFFFSLFMILFTDSPIISQSSVVH